MNREWRHNSRMGWKKRRRNVNGRGDCGNGMKRRQVGTQARHQSKEKDKLAYGKKPEDLLMFAWPGQWNTDIFLVTDSDVATKYNL